MILMKILSRWLKVRVHPSEDDNHLKTIEAWVVDGEQILGISGTSTSGPVEIGGEVNYLNPLFEHDDAVDNPSKAIGLFSRMEIIKKKLRLALLGTPTDKS